LKTGELEGQLVNARWQRLEAEAAVGLGDLHLRLNQRRAGRRHGDARQYRAGVIGERAVDATPEILSHGRAACREHRDQHRAPRNYFLHLCPPTNVSNCT
jgi:hypothetical protein